MINQNVCRHNKYGFCKFGNTCRTRHVEEICETTDCETNLCERRHPRICKFFSEFGRCKFGVFCRFKHESSTEKVRNDQEIQALKELLKLKDEQIAAIAKKIDTIVDFLKNKDTFEEGACEIEQKIDLHELDDDPEYNEKVAYISENENDLEIYDKTFEHEQNSSEGSEIDCLFCEIKATTEIRMIAHMWAIHNAKSKAIVIPRIPP